MRLTSFAAFVVLGSVCCAQQLAQQAYVKASNTGVLDWFGRDVAVDGDTLVVGAQREASSATGVDGDQADNSEPSAGAVYVYVRSGPSWVQEAYLKASNTDAGDEFGEQVAISGDTIVVGAKNEGSAATGVDGDQLDDSKVGAGAAYVFVRSGTAWSQQAYLKASNTGSSDLFGCSVGVSGDTLVVGARQEDSPATTVNGGQGDGAQDSGAAYVFVRAGTTWSQQAYLKPSDTEVGYGFGYGVEVDADTVLVGAPGKDYGWGAAYAFARSGSAWTQQAALEPPLPAGGGSFGEAVDLSGDTALIGARTALASRGSASVFVRTGTTWAEQGELLPANLDPVDQYGGDVSLSGDLVVVGAGGEDGGATGVNGDETDNSAGNSGAAFVFRRSGTVWSQDAYLKASNAQFADFFGYSVAALAGTVVVGAFNEESSATGVGGDQTDNGASDSGAVYVFESGGPAVYCTAKTSSAGCTAQVSTSIPFLQPVSGAADYSVTAGGVQELKNGLAFAGISGPAALPFSGGTLCVQPPTKRGPVASSGGANPLGCGGAYATLVNDGAIVPAGLDAGPGNSAWYQYWYRDPMNGAGTLGTSLSNAVQLDFE